MRSIAEIEDELRRAKQREARQKIACMACDGKGWMYDTTYDRIGEWQQCSRCHGTGLPSDAVARLVDEAVSHLRRPHP